MKIVARLENHELKILYDFLYISLGLAGFLMMIIIIQNRLTFSQFEYAGSASVVITLLLAPLAIVVREELKLWKREKAIDTENRPPPILDQNASSPVLVTPAIEEKSPISRWRNMFNPPERGADYTILQSLFSIDVIVLFTATTFGVGGTLSAIDNLGQIGRSLGYPKKTITTFISLCERMELSRTSILRFRIGVSLGQVQVPSTLGARRCLISIS